jgi:hypothetical protein
MSAARSLLWRPLTSGMVWAGTGVGAGLVVPTVLLQQSWVVSTPIITTSLWGGALLVLLPLGVSRGIISSVQDICQVHGRPALQQALDHDWNSILGGPPAAAANSTLVSNNPQATQRLLERLTLGSGWQGRLVRTVASPFLPSTSQMMVRLQELVEKEQAAATAALRTTSSSSFSSSSAPLPLENSQVLVAAVDGFVEGFLQDKKDTVTTLGLVAYAGILGLGLGVDYSYRRASSAWNTTENSNTNSSDALENRPKQQAFNIHSIQNRLGLSQSRANQEIEAQLEEQYKQGERSKAAATIAAAAAAAQKAKPIPVEEPLSIRDTLDKAQLQVGEMTKWLLKSKEQADPYLQQALEVAETVKDEVEDQATYWFWQAKDAIVDEENQEKFQQQWKSMVQSIQDTTNMSGLNDKTLGQITKDMEDILRQAQKRLNEDDVQEMRKDLEGAIEQAKARIAEEKKRANVDEHLENAKEGLRTRLEDWWNDRKK